jgi:hypothetical protein
LMVLVTRCRPLFLEQLAIDTLRQL